MMKNSDKSNHNPNWPNILDDPYRILVIHGPGSGKTNVLLNLIKHQRPDVDKSYLYVKDPFKSKDQLFINGREKGGSKELKNPKAFIDYSQTIDVYESLEDYKQTKKRKDMIVFDDMIADMEVNKKLSPIVTELFLRGTKLNLSLIFISQSYFKVPKITKLNKTHFKMKIPNKRELQKIASNHSFDMDF